MSNYDDTDKGVLFRNQKKESDSHPDYKGNINVGGTDYWLSAWLNESKDGKKYMKLSVQAKDQQSQQPPRPAQQQGHDYDSEPPF